MWLEGPVLRGGGKLRFEVGIVLKGLVLLQSFVYYVGIELII